MALHGVKKNGTAKYWGMRTNLSNWHRNKWIFTWRINKLYKRQYIPFFEASTVYFNSITYQEISFKREGRKGGDR